MKSLVFPRVIVPLVIGVLIIIVLLGAADVGRVLRVVSGFHPLYVLLLFALALAYEAVRAVQWFLLLRVLDRREPWRAALMSYLGGELSKSLPGGQYVQTYLLRQAQGVPIARSAAATTVILWLEVVVSLVVVLLLGVGPWPWVRPASLLLLGGIALVALALKRRPYATQLGIATRNHRRLHAAWAWVLDFSLSAERLLAPRALGVAAILSAAYLGCAALGLWAIARALGVPGIGLPQALVCYAFALGMGLLIPIPMDLGLTEGSGVAILLASGASTPDAVAIMLIQRVLGALLTSPIAAVSLFAVRRQLGAALHAGARTSDSAAPLV